MNRKWMALTIAIVAAGVLAGCGSKSGDASQSAAGSSASSGASSGAASSLPPGLDDGPRAIESPANETLVLQGEKLFQTRGCSACHGFGKRISCPDLNGVTQRRTAKWIQSQILHPEIMTKQDPTARALFAQFSLQMPNQGLNPTEAAAVLEFLKHKNHEALEKH